MVAWACFKSFLAKAIERFPRWTPAKALKWRSVKYPESGAYLFGEIPAAVVAGGQFEVHASPFSVARFVFDSNVGDGNLSANNLESVPVGDGVFAISGIAVFAELGEIAIKILLQFV